MQASPGRDLLGFIELEVGSVPVRKVRIPLRSAASRGDQSQPLAAFEKDGDWFSIFVRGDPSTPSVEKAVEEAAQQALVHLSRKLLN